MDSPRENLWERYQRTRAPADRSHLAELYLHLADEMANKFLRCVPWYAGVTFDDLSSDARVGLLNAIEGYDPTRGWKFPTYAAPRITGAMRDGLRNRDHMKRGQRARCERNGTKAPTHRSLESFFSRVGAEDAPWVPTVASVPATALVEDFWREACRGLNKQERLILLLYYRAHVSMRAIGQSLALSESRISQMHSQLIAQLKQKRPNLVLETPA